MKYINGFPRRSNVLYMTAEEREIRKVIDSIESLPAHPLLTDAVDFMHKALSKVSDYEDEETPNTDCNLTRAELPEKCLRCTASGLQDGPCCPPSQGKS